MTSVIRKDDGDLKRLLVIIMVSAVIFMCWSCTSKTEQPAVNTSSDSKPWPTKSWSTSTPKEQGINSADLSKSDKYIKDNYPSVCSLLVVRHGYLVYEKYYNGRNADSALPVYSVTKSIMSALTGIAMQQKLIKSIEQPVSELVPNYFKDIDDPNKKNITIKQVLTMTGGLESIDNNYNDFHSAKDWLSQTLKMPLIDEPGTKFVYNTGLIQFLSNIISKTSCMDTCKYADKYLFSKIGINPTSWDRDSQGYYCGGSGLVLTARDMAKFGYLYLNDGQWDGKQIIPKDWVEESTKKQLYAYDGFDYGYLFWVQTAHDSTKNVDYITYRADGYGGQKIIVVPQLDLVAVVTASPDANTKDDDMQNIVFNYVIPAVK